MAKAKKKIEEELPIITTVGIFKTDTGGWRFTELKTQGDVVVDRIETDHDSYKSFVMTDFKRSIVKNFIKEPV